MAKYVELRRHTDNEGDVLTPEGVAEAVEIGTRLSGDYDLLVSSGAQRATQALACFLAGMGRLIPSGVAVNIGFRSEIEDRWFAAARIAQGKGIEDFRDADPELVASEADRFADALLSVFESLPDEGRALVVGHSPMHEAAVFGLTGKVVHPLPKGAGVLVSHDETAGYQVRALE